MNTDKFELKPIDMFAQSSNKTNHTSSNSSLGYISGHKIVLTPKELSVKNDNMAIIHIKSIKFSPADYNKKSIKNLLCGELLYRIKRYLYYEWTH